MSFNTFIVRIKDRLLLVHQRIRAANGYKLVLKYSAIFFLASFVVGLLIILSVYAGLFGALPSRQVLLQTKQPIASEIYSADSVLLGRYYLQDRTPTPLAQISPHVIGALISTEDERFYQHKGIDYRSIGRVAIKSILFQKSTGGGSTLSQQIAKNLFPRKSFGAFTLPIAKVKEIVLARRLESLYTKDEILALYLNTVPFGDNVFGIATASERFFNKKPSDLSPPEAATLIAMLKGTYMYNPRIFPERSLGRRNVVLRQMAKHGYVPSQSLEALLGTPLVLDYTLRDHHEGMAPYFREYLRQQLAAWGQQNIRPDGLPYNLYTDGLKIYTTLDTRMQKHLEEAVQKHMPMLQNRIERQWKSSMPWDKNPEILNSAIRRSGRYAQLKASGLSEAGIVAEMKKPQPIKIFTWEGAMEKTMSPIDSIKHHLRMLQTGSIAMDAKTGGIKAWVGGIDSRYFSYDHAHPQMQRQVGSVFKPIVYAAALEGGAVPCEYLSAERVTYQDEEDWSPSNGTDNYHLKYSMQGALSASVNTVSVRVLEQVGIPAAIDFARRLGITSDIPAVPSIALGTSSLSLLELLQAYGSFAAKGSKVEPYFITSIHDSKGTVLAEWGPSTPQQVMRASTARMMTAMLQAVVEEGTARGLRSTYGLKQPIAGKTGTTQKNADGWFVGYTPRLVVVTWVGADDPRIHFTSTAIGQGAQTAMPIFAYFMQQMERDAELHKLVFQPFEELSPIEELILACEPFKEDVDLFESIFGKKEKETRKRGFGEAKKPSRLQQLLEKRKQRRQERKNG